MAIHVKDEGSLLRVVLPDDEDISGAVSAKIVIKHPYGRPKFMDATIVGQELRYATIGGEIDHHGEWKIQGWLDLGDWRGYTSQGSFTVEPILGDATE